jgi:hypothetical protein
MEAANDPPLSRRMTVGVERRARTSLLADVPDISVIARLDRAIHAMALGLRWLFRMRQR